jgi:hypothetical protein
MRRSFAQPNLTDYTEGSSAIFRSRERFITVWCQWEPGFTVHFIAAASSSYWSVAMKSTPAFRAARQRTMTELREPKFKTTRQTGYAPPAAEWCP